MPCGGIYPIKPGVGVSDYVDLSKPECRCMHCGKPGGTHFCDEWDCVLHAGCIPQFLLGEEGQCVVSHGHSVFIDFSLEPETKLLGRTSYLDTPCICAQGVTKCERHGDQPAERDLCPDCGAVLGYCPQGVYCTKDNCGYAS